MTSEICKCGGRKDQHTRSPMDGSWEGYCPGSGGQKFSPAEPVCGYCGEKESEHRPFGMATNCADYFPKNQSQDVSVRKLAISPQSSKKLTQHPDTQTPETNSNAKLGTRESSTLSDKSVDLVMLKNAGLLDSHRIENVAKYNMKFYTPEDVRSAVLKLKFEIDKWTQIREPRTPSKIVADLNECLIKIFGESLTGEETEK